MIEYHKTLNPKLWINNKLICLYFNNNNIFNITILSTITKFDLIQ